MSLPKRGISGCKFTKNIENDHKNKQKMIIKHGLLLKTAKQIVEQTVFRKKVKALLSDCFIHTMLHCTSLTERCTDNVHDFESTKVRLRSCRNKIMIAYIMLGNFPELLDNTVVTTCVSIYNKHLEESEMYPFTN